MRDDSAYRAGQSCASLLFFLIVLSAIVLSIMGWLGIHVRIF